MVLGRWDAWLVSPATGRLSTTGSTGKTNTTSWNVSRPDLTCWLQQDVVVCSSLRRCVIIRLLPLWLRIAVPVWLQFPPGEHLHPFIFLLKVVPFISILKQSTMMNAWFIKVIQGVVFICHTLSSEFQGLSMLQNKLDHVKLSHHD